MLPEESFLPLSASGGSWCSLVCGSRTSLCLCLHMPCSSQFLCFCVLSLIRTALTGFRTNSKSISISWDSWLHLQRPFFQTRTHSQALRVRTWTHHVKDHHLTPESKAGWFLSVTHLWGPECGLEQVSLRAVAFAGSCTDLGTHGRSVKWGQGKGQQGKNELPSTGCPLQVLRKNR